MEAGSVKRPNPYAPDDPYGTGGRWVGGANPDAHYHRCTPPMRHDGCCDGTGGYTITAEDVRRSEETPGLPISSPAGTRTVCISGYPDGDLGAVWRCHCGQGWVVAVACDICHYRPSGYGHEAVGGVHRTGSTWRALSRWATWRAERRALRAQRRAWRERPTIL